MRMSLGNHITLSPVVGWLYQERWKVAGRNEAVQDAAFEGNKSLLCSSSSILRQIVEVERNGKKGVTLPASTWEGFRALLGNRGAFFTRKKYLSSRLEEWAMLVCWLRS